VLAALTVVAGALAISSPALAALGTISAGGPYDGHVEGEHFTIHGTADGATSHTWTAVRSPNGEKDSASCQIADKSALDTTVWCNDDGSFIMTLTASDGLTTQSSHVAVMLGNVNPLVTLSAPTPGTAVAPHAVVTLNGYFTDPGYVDAHKYVIAWGDGETSSGSAPETQQNGGSGTVTGSHSYAAAGSYTITLTVSENHPGSMDTASTSISVVAGQPCARVSGKGRLPHHRRGSGFSFSVACGSAGPVGRTSVWLARHGTLRSRSVSLLRGSGRTATWSGTGKWQRSGRKAWVKGYRYVIKATDNGRRRDWMNVTVRKPTGVVVLHARGRIPRGYITVRN
jgi:PKD repeat protein